MLDDKDFREDLTHGDPETQAEQGGTAIAPDLIPGYRAEEKPTTTDPPIGQSNEIDSILADIRKIMDDSAQTPVTVPSMTGADADKPPTEEISAEESPAADFPGDGSDEKQLMQNVLAAVRELTDEVKQLRSQIEERPPGSAAGSGDGSSSGLKPNAQSDQKQPVKNRVLSIISSVLFYVVIVAMVLGAFLMRSTSKGSPFMIAGYSAANVLTSSMEDVYPKGSLIVTKQVEAKELQIGDDITFMVSEESSITHRIIEITENYQGTGERAFKTQGTMNAKPDKDMVAAANVVGKVIFHSKAIGDFANFVKANWPILIFVLIVIVGLISFLKWNAKRTDDDEKNLSAEAPSPKKGTHTKRRLRKSEEEVE